MFLGIFSGKAKAPTNPLFMRFSAFFKILKSPILGGEINFGEIFGEFFALLGTLLGKYFTGKIGKVLL